MATSGLCRIHSVPAALDHVGLALMYAHEEIEMARDVRRFGIHPSVSARCLEDAARHRRFVYRTRLRLAAHAAGTCSHGSK